MQSRETVKAYNKSMVMEILRNNDSVSRAELSRNTGLSMPTIMKITDDFIQNGLVVEVGKGTSSGGKPPMMLELVPESRLFVGMDISGAMYKCIIMNLKGGVVFRKNCLRQNVRKAGNDIDTIIEFIDTTIRESGVDYRCLSGLGIGVPGIVKTEKGIVANSIDFGWSNLDLRTPLERYFRIPVYVENSSKVMAVGEQWFGTGRECDNFALVTVGRGIGAAFIINGEIYSGFNNQSGEIGHMVIDADGPACKCGKRGCLETFASGKVIERKAGELVLSGTTTVLRNLCGGNADEITTDMVFAAAELGDEPAKKIADEAADHLAAGLENLVALLDCQRIVLTGYVVKNNRYLLARVRKRINLTRNLYFEIENPVEVHLSAMGEEAAVIGAATIPLRCLVENGGD